MQKSSSQNASKTGRSNSIQKINDSTSVIQNELGSQDHYLPPSIFKKFHFLTSSTIHEHKSGQRFARPLSANSHNGRDRTRDINYKFWTRTYDLSRIVQQRSPLDPWELTIRPKIEKTKNKWHLKSRDPKIWIFCSPSAKKTVYCMRVGQLLYPK